MAATFHADDSTPLLNPGFSKANKQTRGDCTACSSITRLAAPYLPLLPLSVPPSVTAAARTLLPQLPQPAHGGRGCQSAADF